jgi:hypothetical protein
MKAIKSKNIQAYTMLIMSLFTISFFGIFAIRPTLNTIANLNRQIADLKEVDERLSTKINQLIGAQAEYETIVPYIPKIKRAIPDEPKYISTLSDVELIRNTSSATVSSVKIDSIVLGSSKPGFVDIELESQGDFIPIEQLVDQILSNERLMIVLSLNLSQSRNTENTNRKIKLDSEIISPYGAGASQSAIINK